ncbi:cytochrome c-type biogenesis protein CcmH [Psychrobacter frigidicola]|uniref:Cytochrome c-type biogenesis protein n=1 Tax=Psychrobacter frigidicola TaxID=45611 RepID=A0A5C7AD26_9GAMM|nr:cytochrome c-type biogenesis protein [Psychrobacter frigidicola]TXD98663.1 cytochrome c-type biogenesis protein CcmH [Psychrobacter frigidicola]
MGATTPSYAAIDVYDFDSKRQEAQYRGLIDEFRCPKCQNQNLAGSDAPIAQDLKQKTYDMVKDGRSDAEIRQYMQERYGDFISYSPPVRPSTWVLWFFPPLLLIVVLGGWLWRNRGNRTRTIKPRSTVDSSLSAGEQEALDKLLASRMKSSVTEASVNSDEPKLSEVNATKSNSSKLKKNKSKTDKSKTDKRKSNNQARDKGDSL